MKTVIAMVTTACGCVAFASGAFAVDPLKNVDDALSTSAAAVGKGFKTEADLKAIIGPTLMLRPQGKGRP